ncbi:SET and MYND domain-containing protein 4-like isoform X1 [Colletes gigas]|uniref:SET and MYND domain-containing protein 4-like isoform X1 n=1 Tax=Colletes gigas TaxID=935657 RepID=UPI001C9B443C|nr:SET and MYND domain-containing protein 4-like isoform X1 [Colletes gigas]
MSITKGCVKFSEFLKTVYDVATTDPFASRFKALSTNGDREGMIKILMDVPYIKSVRIVGSCTGKDDVKASEIYGKCRVVENGVTRYDEGRISDLTETLFTASVSSRLFLDALLDCARHWYESKAYARCLRYCECMLALPANFYNKTADSTNDFLERRKACLSLESECKKRLKASSSRDRKARRKRNSGRSTSLENAFAGDHGSTPDVDGKQHAVLKSCSDAVALKFVDKRGRCLVATRNIEAGTVLIVEPPFAFSTNKEAFGRNCLHCHVTFKLDTVVKIPCYYCRTVSFCSEKCRKEAWHTYHRYECSVFDVFHEDGPEQTQRHTSHLLLAYRMTIVGSLSSNTGKTNNNNNTEENDVPFLNDNFLRYRATSAKNERSDLGTSEAYNSGDYRTVLEMETHCATLEPNVNLIRAIEAIFLSKCFTFALSKLDIVCLKETLLSLAVATMHHLQAINCNAYEIVENVYDKGTHVWEPRHVGGAIYPSVSLVNHSCYPNVVRHSYPSGTVVVRALRFIGKDTEILDCYGPHFLSESKLQRREYLWKKYRFLCACEACTQNWQYPLPETMNYNCRACSGMIGALALNENDTRNVSQCLKCDERIDWRKLNGQLRKSIDKRSNAISKMYEGRYAEALIQLLEHIHFIEKYFTAPNIETIKTQQCIIQCYNQFGCTSQQ